MDGQRRGEDVLVLDRSGLAEVGGRAEVLDGGGQLEHRLGGLEREHRLRLRRRLRARLLDGRGQRGDVLVLVALDLLDQGEVLALEEAALRHVGVERGLEILEGKRVVDDADVPLAELGQGVVARRLGGLAGHRGGGVVFVILAAGGKEGRGRARAAGEHEEAAPRHRVRRDSRQCAPRPFDLAHQGWSPFRAPSLGAVQVSLRDPRRGRIKSRRAGSG
jgi:hypothetical protein